MQLSDKKFNKKWKKFI